MGIGVVAIQTTQKKEPQAPPGPPFVPGSADNGLSVDPLTTRIVLGNIVGEAGSPAQLLSDREIITEDALFNLFAVVLDAFFTGIQTRLEGMGIQITGAAGTFPYFIMTTSGAGFNQIQMNGSTGSDNQILLNTSGAGGVNLLSLTQTAGAANILLQTAANGIAQFRIRSVPDSFEIFTAGTGTIRFSINQIQNVWEVVTATGNTQIGPTLTTSNTAALQVTGSLTNRRFIQGQGAGTYGVNRDLDSSKNFINSAAAQFDLPDMAGASDRPGFIFRLCVKNVAGVTIQLFAGQTALFGSLSTSAGGTLASTDVGASIVMVWDSANWTTESFLGAWVLT